MGVHLENSNREIQQNLITEAFYIVTVFLTVLINVNSMPQVPARNNICSSAVCEDNTVADFVSMTPELSSLFAAVKAAELVETLSGEGSFTVFAPVDKAFEAVPDLEAVLEDTEALSAILLRHVVPEEIQSGQIPEGETVVATAGGEEITVTRAGDSVTVTSGSGEASVVIADILANNGVIHLIDAVV